MPARREDLQFREMLKSILKRLDALENKGAKPKINDIRLGEVTVGTDKQSSKVKVINQASGAATLLGKDEDAKWSFSGVTTYTADEYSPNHIMSESLTAIEVVASLRIATDVDIPFTVNFQSVSNSGTASGSIIVNGVLPANKHVWVTPCNVPCARNSIIYVGLLPFTPTVAPTDFSVFLRFGIPQA